MKICSLNQDLIKEDTNVPIDPASKESINDDAINSGAQVTIAKLIHLETIL